MAFEYARVKQFHFYVPRDGNGNEPLYDIRDFDFGHFETSQITILYSPQDLDDPYTQNGVWISLSDEEDIRREFGANLSSAILIQNDVVAIPEGVQHLSYNCIRPDRDCPIIYIPSSVISIDSSAFRKEEMILVTTEPNLDNLSAILPDDMKGCDIYVI